MSDLKLDYYEVALDNTQFKARAYGLCLGCILPEAGQMHSHEAIMKALYEVYELGKIDSGKKS